MVEKKKSKAPKKAKKPVKERVHKKSSGVAKKPAEKAAKPKKHKRKEKVKGQKVKSKATETKEAKGVKAVGKKPLPEKKVEAKEPKPEEKAEVEEPKPEETAKPVKKKKSRVEKERTIEKVKFSGKRVLSNEETLVMKKRFNEKRRKPNFPRQELSKLKRLDDKWRRPRGIDSKRQERQRGKGRVPSIGYKKSMDCRGIHPSGYYPVLIRNSEDLKRIKSENEAAIISSSVGRKKRNSIIKLANELKIAILNTRKGEL